MDNINFTGIRNIGAFAKPLTYTSPNVKVTHMIINLTDDYNGKDLTEFKEVAKKCEPIIGRCEFGKNPNFIHIMTSLSEKKDSIPILVVNYLIIPIKRETLSMFSFVAKLTRRISQMSDNQFEISNDFKFGPAGDSYILPCHKVSTLNSSDPKKTKELLNEIYSPANNKRVAKIINKQIQYSMEDYLK